MLRRSTSSTSAHMQRSLRVTRSSDVCSALALCSPSRSFFDNLKKQLSSMGANATKDTNNSSSSTSSSSSSSGGSTDSKGMPQMPPGFAGGFNAQQMQTLQQLFNSQPKEKQEQLLKQAMEMQKMMGKVPGLGKMAQKNAAMMEQMLKMTSAATAGPAEASMQSTASSPSSPHTASSSSSSSANGPSVGNRRDLFKDAAHASANAPRSGPSLDELKKVNLGPEIEALFAELRTIRARKNEYRDKFHAAQAALARLQQDHGDLVTREASVRGKLSKAEQEVMLLTSENMELRDSSKSVKQLTQANKQLRQEVERLRAAAQASAAPGTASYATLKQQHQATEDAMRSLQRKVDRMRRRDPLLQFSLACSDVSRLCATVRTDDTSANAAITVSSNTNSNSSSATASSHNGVASQASERSQEAAEQAFSALQNSYYTHQRQAWAQAAQEHGAAAAAYVAVVRRFVMTRVPYSHYDAAVTFTGDRARLQATVASVGFHLEAIPGETNKVHILAAADAETPVTQPGPYGYAFALRMATTSAAAAAAGAGATTEASFAVTAVQPFVSSTLVQNAKRSVVVFETARASGPGGQATNVTETQVYAKLSIDGVAAFTAEAQDSRSALSNKEAALEKLQHQRRQQYNDTLAKQERADAVQSQLIELVQSQGGLTVEDDVAQLVTEAAAAKEVEAADAALVAMMRELGRAAAAAPGGQSS